MSQNTFSKTLVYSKYCRNNFASCYIIMIYLIRGNKGMKHLEVWKTSRYQGIYLYDKSLN